MLKIEEEKIEQSTFLQEPAKILFWEAFLFFLTLLLGLAAALRQTQLQETGVIAPPPPVSLWRFIISVSVLLLMILLFIKFVKFQPRKALFFKVFFILAVFFGGVIFFELWLGTIPALFLILFLICLWLKKPNIFVHNTLLIFGMAGVGSFLGLALDPLLVVILLIVFSIYDIIAVYKTKHMIKMAKEFIEAKAIPGLILPQKFSEVSAPLKEVKMGGKFLILGSGDIIFPLFLVSSLVPLGLLKSFLVVIFATIGLLTSIGIFLSQKTRKPIPALPPIALFSIIGYLITRIL